MAKVLVVDDLEDNRRLLQFDLEDDGHEVLLAASGGEALAIVEQHAVDLILLDLNMPGMSGLDLLKSLQTKGVLDSIPVIVVSANELDQQIIHALDMGANDYVAKPYTYPILAARLRTSLRLKHAQDNLRRMNKRLEILATTDALTGLYNRRHFLDLGTKEVAKAVRHQRDLVVIMMDVDGFKQVNDEYGHDTGDRLLKVVSALARECFRSSDIIARLGSEELALCLPDTTLGEAEIASERFRERIASNRLSVVKASKPLNIGATVSIGVAGFRPDDPDLATVLRRADAALSRAKHEGGNRIILAD